MQIPKGANGTGGRRAESSRPTGSHHPIPAAPRGSTREGASKRVAQTALRFCRTVATGGRTAVRQRAPRAGTFAPGFRTKLSRTWGPGGGRLRAPLGARRSRPPAILWWLSDRSESHSPPAGGEIPPIKRYGTNPAAGASPRPTVLHHTGVARRVVAPRADGPFLSLGANTPGWPLLPLRGNSPSVPTGPRAATRGRPYGVGGRSSP